MLRRNSFSLTWLVVLACTTQSALGQNEPTTSPNEYHELIERLGDPSYQARERATAELSEIGIPATQALNKALSHPDLEVRVRAQRILSYVTTHAFESRITAFINATGETQQIELPGWRRFRELVGNDRKSRTMFAAMTRCDGELLQAYESQSADLPDLFAARITLMQSQGSRGNASPQDILKPSLAALLLVGSDKTSKEHARNVTLLYSLLCQSVALQSIGTQSHPSILRTLLTKCAECTAERIPSYGISLALKYNLKEHGLKLATKMLSGATTSSSSVQSAIIILGRFGSKEHLPLIASQLENKKICHRWGNRQLKKDGTINVEVRDVALVVTLRLLDKSPADYGFKLLQENPETLYHTYTFGFVHDEERESAHAKWAAENNTEEKK